MDTSNTKLKNVRKIGNKKNNILKINEKMTKLDSDISELYRKYSQTKRERLSQEKNQKSIMNRIKYLEDEEKKMRVKCKLQQQKINALTKRLEAKKNEEKFRTIGTDNYNKSHNKKITNFKYLQKAHHRKDSSNEQSLDSDPTKKKINIKNNIIIINNNKYDQNTNISEILLNDKLHLINEKNINDDELNNKDKYTENNQDNLDTNRNRTELEESSLYESDNGEDGENNSLPVYNYEIVKAEDYHEPATIIQPNKRNSYNNNNKNVKNFQKNKSGINKNTKIKNPKSKIDNNIPNYKRNNSAVNKRFYKPKKNNPFKIEKPDKNKNNSFLIKKNITTIDIKKEKEKEKDKNKNSKNTKINKKDNKKKINKRKEENKERLNKSLEVRRKKKDKNAGENKSKKIKIIKRHLFFDKMSKNYSERDNNLRKSNNYTTKNRFNNGTNNITYDFVINDDKIYYNNNDKKRYNYNIIDTDSNSLVNKDINQNYIYLKNEEKMKKIILNNKK